MFWESIGLTAWHSDLAKSPSPGMSCLDSSTLVLWTSLILMWSGLGVFWKKKKTGDCSAQAWRTSVTKPAWETHNLFQHFYVFMAKTKTFDCCCCLTLLHKVFWLHHFGFKKDWDETRNVALLLFSPLVSIKAPNWLLSPSGVRDWPHVSGFINH